MTYAQYEEQAEKEREDNRKIIHLFRKWLAEKGLKEKTINKHFDNILFNDYQATSANLTNRSGIGGVRTTSRSNRSTIRSS